MIISFTEENISEYAYSFPKGECIFDLSIERESCWEDAAKRISTLLKENCGLFKNGTLYLWLKSESFKNPSRLKKLKGVWNNNELEWLQKKQCLLYSHLNDDEEFYSALATINEVQLGACLDFVRANNASFLFFVPEKIQSDEFDSYLSECYSDLEKVISFFFEKNTIFIRVSGNFDDKELSVDFFGKREMLTNIIQEK
ncbi:MAG: hypothetical protein ACI4LX_09885 [Treponema sp.]